MKVDGDRVHLLLPAGLNQAPDEAGPQPSCNRRFRRTN
jgi:hypothetical protein